MGVGVGVRVQGCGLGSEGQASEVCLEDPTLKGPPIRAVSDISETR